MFCHIGDAQTRLRLRLDHWNGLLHFELPVRHFSLTHPANVSDMWYSGTLRSKCHNLPDWTMNSSSPDIRCYSLRLSEHSFQHPLISNKSMSKIIAVIGATGAQGLAVVKHLLAESSDGSASPWKVRALTRNPNHERAKELESLGVEILQGMCKLHPIYTPN